MSPAAAELGQVVFGDITLNGSGCPQGTGTLALSSDRTTLSVTTSAYRVTTEGAAAGIRQFCQASLGFDAPAGIRLGIATARFTADVDLVASGTAKLSVERRFALGADDQVDRDLAAPVSGVVTVEGKGTVWAGCGASGIAIVETKLLVGGNDADVEGTRLAATLVAERCQ